MYDDLCQSLGITRIANITGLDHLGIPVANAIRPNAKHLSVSQGKGLTWEEAKTSAIMEACETFHVENPKPAVLFGSYHDLHQMHPVVHPKFFQQANFDNDLSLTPLSWINAIHFRENQSYLIPHDLINFDSTIALHTRKYFQMDSTGLAAHVDRDAAILHALYEVVERHSLSLSQAALIDGESLHDHDVCELLRKLTRANMNTQLFSLSNPFDIPTIYVQITERQSNRTLGTFHGSASHHSMTVAITKAILEAAQSRLTFIAGTRDEILPFFYRHHHQSSIASSHAVSFALPSSVVYQQDQHAIDDVLSKIERYFPSILLVDHTKEDINIPVVQVFVPGMVK